MHVPVSRTSRMPFYEQLRQSLLSQLRDGSLAAGDRLQSEAELCRLYGVSRTVVRQALGELVRNGYLRRIQGKGTFVTEPKLREHFLHTAGGFFHDLASQGHEVRSEVLGCAIQPASASVAQALDLREGAAVVVLERLRRVDGEPMVFTRSYLSTDLAPGLATVLDEAELTERSLYSFLEERFGLVIASAIRTVEAVALDRATAGKLEARPGSPGLLLKSVARNRDGRPIEHFEAWHRGDRTMFEISVDGSAGTREA